MIITDLINEDAIDIMRKEIENAMGNEVFFRGIPNQNDIVVDVEVIARGNESSVAALLNMMKKNEVIIHNHPSGMLIPSNEDIQISSIYGESGGASYIINNNVDDIYVIVPIRKYEKINIDEFFGKKGKIKQIINNFETRDEQYEMSKEIEEVLNKNKKLVVEAGTGTGKTIAYLIPTLLYALQNNLRVVISTNTINLQEQLLNKDIPLIKNIIPKDFDYELVKGMGNYICKRKLYNINTLEGGNDTEEEKVEKRIIKNLATWDETTNTGDKSELKYEVSYKIWEKVNCESDICNRVKCPYYSDCHFFKARKDIKNADLLIVNHHMYFADLSVRIETGFNTDYSILPNYDILVFDEAHNIEDIARNYFSYEISRFTFGKLIGNIYNRRVVSAYNSGALTKLLIYLNENISQQDYLKIDKLKEEVINKLNKYYDTGIEILDKIIYPFAQDLTNNEIKTRIDTTKVKKSKFWNEIINLNDKLKDDYANLIKANNKLTNAIDNFGLEDEDGIIFDYIKYFERVKQYYKSFQFIIDMSDTNYVYWLLINPNKANVKLYATPFDVSNELNNNLFTKMNRMIFTSATLSVDNKFDYYKKSIGLVDNKIKEKIIHSPFDYEKQMKVYIPNNSLDPNDIDFFDDLEQFIEKTIKSTKGKCFILFTSYSSMNYLYNKIKRYFNQKEYTLIKQNDYPRHEMIEIFKNSKNPVLFGTDSFWEGVDVQGEQLQSVIIVKLPFKVPNDPVTEAIIENIKKNGKNPFNDYQVPQAVIKFKQGVGRLIRSKDDKGIITILDNRVIKKVYGKKFLSALPKNIIKTSKENILEIIGGQDGI